MVAAAAAAAAAAVAASAEAEAEDLAAVAVGPLGVGATLVGAAAAEPHRSVQHRRDQAVAEVMVVAASAAAARGREDPCQDHDHPSAADHRRALVQISAAQDPAVGDHPLINRSQAVDQALEINPAASAIALV